MFRFISGCFFLLSAVSWADAAILKMQMGPQYSGNGCAYRPYKIRFADPGLASQKTLSLRYGVQVTNENGAAPDLAGKECGKTVEEWQNPHQVTMTATQPGVFEAEVTIQIYNFSVPYERPTMLQVQPSNNQKKLAAYQTPIPEFRHDGAPEHWVEATVSLSASEPSAKPAP